MRNVPRLLSLVIVVLVMPILIFSCSSKLKKQYESHVSSFLGVEEAELVQKWGPPQQAYESGGRKYLTYSSEIDDSNESYRTKRGVIYGTSDPAIWSSSSQWSQNKIKRCVTTFELAESKVVAYEWEGNNCVAP